jgi:CRP-like cAMP-binding protein
MLLTQNLYKNCLDSLKIKPEDRTADDIDRMLPYINTLLPFINSLKQANLKNFNATLREILQNMILESVPKDRFVLKYGEKGNLFYIILNGSVSIIVVKNRKGYLSEEEYIDHLLQLRKNKEIELLRMTIGLNNMVYHFEENFDTWLKNQVSKKDSPYSKDLLHQMNTTLQYMKYNIDCFQDGVNNEKYLKFVNLPYFHETSEKNRKAVTIPFYEFINSFSNGQTFGYFALESPNQKRTATLITNEDCDFGVVSREVYNKLLKSVNDIIKRKFYQTVYSLPLFKDVARATFENYYYNLFEYKLLSKGVLLLEEGEISNIIYIVNSGEYEISVKCNVIEINNILIFLKDLAGKRKKKKRFPEEEENDELNLVKKFKPESFMNAINKKYDIKLGIIKNKDIIGLHDLVNEKTSIAQFTVKCLIHDSDVYTIERKLYQRMYLGYEGEDFVKTKLPFLIDRLESFKKTIFNKIERKDKELRKNNIHLYLKIKKPENEMTLLRSISNNHKIIEMIKSNQKFSTHFTTFNSHSFRFHDLNLKNKKKRNPTKIDDHANTDGNVTNYQLPIIGSGTLPKKHINKILNKGLYSTIFRSYINNDNDSDNSNNFNDSQSNNNISNIKSNINSSRLYNSTNFSSTKREVGVFDPLIMDKFNFCYRNAIKNLLKEYKKK